MKYFSVIVVQLKLCLIILNQEVNRGILPQALTKTQTLTNSFSTELYRDLVTEMSHYIHCYIPKKKKLYRSSIGYKTYWGELKCLSMGEKLNRLWYIKAMDSATGRTELIHATTGMNLKGFMLSKKIKNNQSQKVVCTHRYI